MAHRTSQKLTIKQWVVRAISLASLFAAASRGLSYYQNGIEGVPSYELFLFKVSFGISLVSAVFLFLPLKYLVKPLLGLGIYALIGFLLTQWKIQGSIAPYLKGAVYYSSVVACAYCALYDFASFVFGLLENINRRFSPLEAPSWADESWNNTAEKGAALEDYVCELYRRIYGNAMTTTEMKLKGLIPNGPGDQGADVVVELPGRCRLIIQCKNYSSALGNDAVQEIMTARAHYKAHELAIVAPKGFTSKCVELAKSNAEYYNIKLHLIDSSKLEELVSMANRKSA